MSLQSRVTQARDDHEGSVDDLLRNIASDGETFLRCSLRCTERERVYQETLLEAAQRAQPEQAEAYQLAARKIVVGRFAALVGQSRERQGLGPS